MPNAEQIIEWFGDPGKRDLAIASMFSGLMMYRAYKMQGVIGKGLGIIGARLDGKKVVDYLRESLRKDREYDKYQIDHSRWVLYQSKWAEFTTAYPDASYLHFLMHFYPGYRIGMETPPDATNHWQEMLRWKNADEPQPPDDLEWYLKPPSPEMVATIGTVAFIVALKPELLTETIKGFGRILQGIGEIVPL